MSGLSDKGKETEFSPKWGLPTPKVAPTPGGTSGVPAIPARPEGNAEMEEVLDTPGSPPSVSDAVDETSLSHVLVFKAESREYALPVRDVVEVVRMVVITPLPKAPSWVDGVLNFRGRVIPVLDLRARLGIPRREPDLSTPIVITAAESGLFGLVADELVEVLPLSRDQVDAPNAETAATPAVASMIRHDDRLILVLDAHRLHDEPLDAILPNDTGPDSPAGKAGPA